MTRIAITGIGVIAPGAIGVDQFAALLDNGKNAIAPIDRFDTTGLRAHNAALVRDFVAKDFISPMKLRRMNTLSRFGVAAARLATMDRGDGLPNAAGVAMGTAFGPVQTSVDYMQEYVEKGAALAPPQLFAESVANAPGSHVGIEFGLRGFNVTLTPRCERQSTMRSCPSTTSMRSTHRQIQRCARTGSNTARFNPYSATCRRSSRPKAISANTRLAAHCRSSQRRSRFAIRSCMHRSASVKAKTKCDSIRRLSNPRASSGTSSSIRFPPGAESSAPSCRDERESADHRSGVQRCADCRRRH